MIADALPLILLGAFQMLSAFIYGAYLLRRNAREGES